MREYSCGPASDEHAGGWPQGKKEPEHVYLNVVGGFLEGEVKRADDGVPTLTFRHYSVDGEMRPFRFFSAMILAASVTLGKRRSACRRRGRRQHRAGPGAETGERQLRLVKAGEAGAVGRVTRRSVRGSLKRPTRSSPCFGRPSPTARRR